MAKGKRNDSPESIRALIESIAEMASREDTPENERAAAQQRLDALLLRYGLKLEDVVDRKHEKKQHYFQFDYPWQYTLLRYISYYVAGEYRAVWIGRANSRRQRKEMWVELTDPEYQEALDLYLEHYMLLFERELDEYLMAMIYKNKIYPPATASDEEVELSAEERERIKRLREKMGVAPKVEVYKRLEAPKDE